MGAGFHADSAREPGEGWEGLPLTFHIRRSVTCKLRVQEPDHLGLSHAGWVTPGWLLNPWDPQYSSLQKDGDHHTSFAEVLQR